MAWSDACTYEPVAQGHVSTCQVSMLEGSEKFTDQGEYNISKGRGCSAHHIENYCYCCVALTSSGQFLLRLNECQLQNIFRFIIVVIR